MTRSSRLNNPRRRSDPSVRVVTPILETRGFAAAVLDSLSSHICVIDNEGVIVAVNRAWKNFAADNPPASDRTGVGSHYLKVCQDSSGSGAEEAGEFALGVRSVLRGSAELFQKEYPCHSPTVNRWFLGRVTPLRTGQGGAVISHMAITDRKLLEFELVRLANADSLTGLPNRRYFLETGELEVRRVKRFGRTASVIMIDLDHFKTVNDRFGHAVGDVALRDLARVCRKLVRKIDILARLGGEEFAILSPETDEPSATRLGEKLRQAVADTPIDDGLNRFGITASFGVAEVCASDAGIGECLRRADFALYAAKRAGRNCVMSFAAIPLDTTKSDA